VLFGLLHGQDDEGLRECVIVIGFRDRDIVEVWTRNDHSRPLTFAEQLFTNFDLF